MMEGRSLTRLLPGLLRILLLVVVPPLLLLAGCQSSLIYFPRPYAAGTTAEWQSRTQGRMVDYETSQGSQRAFLQGNLKSPRNLWIVCGGNGTVALDWSQWLESHAPREDAWLLVDFPGYGDSEGAPTPQRIRESLLAAVPLAARELGWPATPDPQHLRFFGHSLGAAACLIAASEFKIQRGVVIAPFTSTMEMSRHMTGLPLGFLVWHRFDNAARLDELVARGPGKVIILHGSGDAAIPCSMSRALASRHPETLRLIEIADAGHNDIQDTAAAQLAGALRETGDR